MTDKAPRLPSRGECPFFDALPQQALGRILARAFDVEVPRGGVLYREGGAPRCFLVRSGLVRVYMESAEGRQVTVRYARPNDLLGVATAVAGPAPVAAQALVDSHLLAFDPGSAEEGHRDARVAWAIAEELGRGTAARARERLRHGRSRTSFGPFDRARPLRATANVRDLAGPHGGTVTALRDHDAGDDLSSAADRIGELLLRDVHDRMSLLAWSRRVEEVARDAIGPNPSFGVATPGASVSRSSPG